MNISEVSQHLAGLMQKAGSLFLSGNDDLARQLAIGQIIKGKVLRSYDNGQYLMDFSGARKVVDSTVPLRNGEQIQARVSNIGDRIELKRLVVQNETADVNSSDKFPGSGLLASKWETMLVDALQKYQVRIDGADRNLLLAMMKKADQPQLMLLGAIALIKQKLPLNADLLQLLNDLQKSRSPSGVQPDKQMAPVFDLADSNISAPGREKDASVIVDALIRLGQEQREIVNQDGEQQKTALNPAQVGQDGSQDDDTDNREFAFNWRLLNTQVDGALQHRYSTLPLWLGDRLVELNVAIYEQRHNADATGAIKHRRIIFSLELDNLGLLEIEMHIENRNLRLRISSDSHETSQQLLQYGHLLNDQIDEAGWSLDEISYSTSSRDELGHIASSVIEHYLSQDSLSRLM